MCRFQAASTPYYYPKWTAFRRPPQRRNPKGGWAIPLAPFGGDILCRMLSQTGRWQTLFISKNYHEDQQRFSNYLYNHPAGCLPAWLHKSFHGSPFNIHTNPN